MFRTLFLSLVFISLLSPVAWADNTHGLPSLGQEIQADFGDAHRDYVADGCLHGTSVTTSAVMSSCRAHSLETGPPRRLKYLQELTPRTITYSAGSGTYWLIAHATKTEVVGGWTRVAGTHYLWLLSATLPPIPQRSTLLLQAIVAGGAITAVGDLRQDAPFRQPVNARSPLFGVVADCVTDTTTGLQAAVNNALWRQQELYIPSGCYVFNRLWLVFDSVSNTTAPNIAQGLGSILIKGAGAITFSDMTREHEFLGTMLKSTNSVGPAITASFSGSLSSNVEQVSLRDLTIKATNSTYVIHTDRVIHSAVAENVGIQQNGTGGGWLFDNSFVTQMNNVWILGKFAGIGLWVRHSLTAGGLLTFTNVNVRDFDKSVLVGGAEPPSDDEDKIMQTVTFNASQFKGSRINLEVSSRVHNLTCINCHNEGSTEKGIYIHHNAGNTLILGGIINCNQQDLAHATDACIWLGDANLTNIDRDVNNTKIDSTYIVLIKKVGIRRDVVTFTSVGLTVENVYFGSVDPGGAIAISCGDTSTAQHSVVFNQLKFSENVDFPFATPKIVNCDQINSESADGYTRFGSPGIAVGGTMDTMPTTRVVALMHGKATLDFGVVAANSCIDTVNGGGNADIVVTGAKVGDSVPILGVPAAPAVAHVVYTGRITGANNVRVRACNMATAASGDPGSGEFVALVTEMAP